ncbi:MAG: hypothetical protein EAZ55_02295 [Cytophagales bacterium]|nr:MAG: hypothetical protein EAZ55_02295 [Cytophagales bacterium]
MVRVVRFIKIISLIAFLFILSLTYYDTSDKGEQIALYFAKAQSADAYSIEKNMYFYANAIFVLLLNFLISMAITVLRNFPLEMLSFPQKKYWTATPQHRKELYSFLENWCNVLAIAMNIFMMLLLYHIWQINRNLQGSQESYLLYVILLIVIVSTWALFLPIRLLFKKS